MASTRPKEIDKDNISEEPRKDPRLNSASNTGMENDDRVKYRDFVIKGDITGAETFIIANEQRLSPEFVEAAVELAFDELPGTTNSTENKVREEFIRFLLNVQDKVSKRDIRPRTTSEENVGIDNKDKTTDGYDTNRSCIVPFVPGIANAGNTCYLNTVLQCLKSCQGFSRCLLKLNRHCLFDKPLTASLQGVMDKLSSSQTSVYLTNDTLRALTPKRFKQWEQQDCMECFRHILATMDDEANPLRDPTNTTQKPESLTPDHLLTFFSVFVGTSSLPEARKFYQIPGVQTLHPVDCAYIWKSFWKRKRKNVFVDKSIVIHLPHVLVFYNSCQETTWSVIKLSIDIDESPNQKRNMHLVGGIFAAKRSTKHYKHYWVFHIVLKSCLHSTLKCKSMKCRHCTEFRMVHSEEAEYNKSEQIEVRKENLHSMKMTAVALFYKNAECEYAEDTLRQVVHSTIKRTASSMTMESKFSPAGKPQELFAETFLNLANEEFQLELTQQAKKVEIPKVKDTNHVEALPTSYFGGEFQTLIKCCNGHEDKQLERFYDLALPITTATVTEKVDIQKAIDMYFTTKDVSDEDFQCQTPGCNARQSYKITTTISQGPEVLLISLQRYMRNVYGIRRKNTVSTSLPFTLELHDVGERYVLAGLISHHGYSLNSGHYIFFGREDTDNRNDHNEGGRVKWICCNDSLVRMCDFHDLQKESSYGNSYVLVYKKIN